MTMEFTTFAKLLYPIIGGASSTHAFTKTLFDSILDDEYVDILDEVKEKTYQSYYNGNTGISRLAKKTVLYLNPDAFVEYLDVFPVSTTDKICDAFKPFLPEITTFDAFEQIANLFESIIKEAAAAERKAPSVKTDDPDLSPFEAQLLKSGKAVADVFGAAFDRLDKEIESQQKEKPITPSGGSVGDEHEAVEAEVVDDDEPSGAADDKKITVIQQQTNVVQNGQKNINLTNNGTINIQL